MKPIGIDLYEPALGEFVRGLTERERRRVATSIAALLVQDTDEHGPEIGGALSACAAQRFGESPAREALGRVAHSAELKSLALEHEWEQHTVSEEVFNAAFLRSRALHALLYALDADSASSVLWTLNEAYQYFEESPRWDSRDLRFTVDQAIESSGNES